MKRRDLITLLGAATAWPFAARAQPAPPIPKIGWLKIQGRQHTPDQLKAFRAGMKALGLVEQRDFVLDERYAGGDESRLPSLAAELIDSGVAIIVATSQPSIAAAWRVTKTVPVIGRMVDDPVNDGMAQSLARPMLQNIGGIITFRNPTVVTYLDLIAGLSRKYRLPAVFDAGEYVEAGGLMSYGPNIDEVYRQLARFVPKLLHGTPPAELPIEQPTTFELVVNNRTADDIGLPIPVSLLVRANRVIK